MEEPGRRLELTGQQLAFYRAIAEGDSELAGWYLGVQFALAEPANPESLVHAAHSVRELIDELHKVADLPARSAGGNLGDQVAVMAEKWERAQRDSQCYSDGEWIGEIDGAAQRGFKAVEALLEWRRENRPLRRERHREVIRGLDVSGQPLPSWIEDRFIAQWEDLRDFFIKVAHHGHVTDVDEFNAALGTLERFVLERLKPRTFTEHATIEALIKEAESGA